MFAFGIVTGWWISIFIVEIIWGCLYTISNVSRSRNSTGVCFAITSIFASLWLIGWFNPITAVTDHYISIIAGLVVYLVFAFPYAYWIELPKYLKESYKSSAEQIKWNKEAFLRENRKVGNVERTKEELQLLLEKETEKYPESYTIQIPTPKQIRPEFINWMAFWPLILVYRITVDFLLDIFEWVKARFNSIYNYFSDRIQAYAARKLEKFKKTMDQ